MRFVILIFFPEIVLTLDENRKIVSFMPQVWYCYYLWQPDLLLVLCDQCLIVLVFIGTASNTKIHNHIIVLNAVHTNNVRQSLWKLNVTYPSRLCATGIYYVDSSDTEFLAEFHRPKITDFSSSINILLTLSHSTIRYTHKHATIFINPCSSTSKNNYIEQEKCTFISRCVYRPMWANESEIETNRQKKKTVKNMVSVVFFLF